MKLKRLIVVCFCIALLMIPLIVSNAAETVFDPSKEFCLIGDANLDGSVNSEDARLILRYVARFSDLTEEQKALADVDGNGTVNAFDARQVLRFVAKLDPQPKHHVVHQEAVAATCVSSGLTEGSYCDICGKVFLKQETIPAHGLHTIAVDEYVAPTCTKPGLSKGYHCLVCNTVIDAQVEIPARGHKFGDWQVVKAATCVAVGLEKRTCSVCEFSETRAIPAHGLHTVEIIEAKEPTCTEDGHTLGVYCSVCEKTFIKSEKIYALDHLYEVVPAVPATWTKTGLTEYTQCSRCGDKKSYPEITPTKLCTTVNAANLWARDNNLDSFIEVIAVDDQFTVNINVDGIWSYSGEDFSSFDGLMTFVGEFIKTNFGTDDVKINGHSVYVNGKLSTPAIKKVLFDVGAGFFLKIANLNDSGVYGVYDVEIAGEEITLTVKFVGSDENLNKVKQFAQVIADHIYADTSGHDLVIGIDLPDALRNYILSKVDEGQKPLDVMHNININSGLNLMAGLDVSEVFGSNVSAVNKALKFFCDLSGFANKVVGKIEKATVTLANGTEVNLFKDNAGFNYDPTLYEDGDYYNAFMTGIVDMLSDELKNCKVGDFACEDGTYVVPVNITVNIANLGDVAAVNTVEETIIFRIHFIDI
ncbi:MAG TPA: dockerin type I repeat-containing protein, partial [Clostridiales bacterium]|nr:dockerin type I repeat-containing protein [Clostridiales bacterium]